MKKLLYLLIGFSILTFFFGCKKENQATNNNFIVTTSLTDKPVIVGNIPCNFPLVKDKQALNIVISCHNSLPQKDVYVWQKYAQMTGVDVNWTSVNNYTRDEIIFNILSNRKNCDLILKCRFSTDKLTNYGKSKFILNLNENDMLRRFAPNCWAYLQSHPVTLASVQNPDGSIYSLPQVNSGAELRVARKLFINKKWLERTGQKLPTTTEELYQLLKVFKEKDANGNGIVGDEIPLCCHDWGSLQDLGFGPFGLGNRGSHNNLVDCDEDTGKIRFIAATPEYKGLLQYLNKLYSEKLLDKNIFTITQEQWCSNAANDLIGAFMNTNLAWIPANMVDDWVGIEEALTGPEGYKLWSPIRADFHSPGAAVIPAVCKNPELVLRWLDYFWTDEGTLFYHLGIEGETFTVKEDGSYDYMPYIYNQVKAGNMTLDDVLALYSPYPGGNNPTVEIAPYFKGGEVAPVPAKAARDLIKYGPKEYWPSFTFTTEESILLGTIQTDITKYLSTMQIEFITGLTPLTEWNTYLDQLKKMRVSELLQVYETALARYYKAKNSKK